MTAGELMVKQVPWWWVVLWTVATSLVTLAAAWLILFSIETKDRFTPYSWVYDAERGEVDFTRVVPVEGVTMQWVHEVSANGREEGDDGLRFYNMKDGRTIRIRLGENIVEFLEKYPDAEQNICWWVKWRGVLFLKPTCTGPFVGNWHNDEITGFNEIWRGVVVGG